MTEQEFDKKFDEFIKQFNESFDSKDNMDQIGKIALKNTDSEEDIAFNTEHIYQQQRVDNLVRLALKNFLELD
ncbi:hypothetical protein [Companilactobacillus bobalius]|jgi:hypothetical protein|uniref:Uncharacterized protein n=2 Tax=Companilactobacillus bobalius TaxID=2801451 RepID=A0A202F5S2_9LACO|nr:hypothetical protein [Companilactobacillus bobalius]KAE9560691.1 hypothetical protein ATN92_11185 [Companilactobacillus bobalius]KRK85033.1 hypothetical protein FC78_GL000835 [Companilactobacillus bobalius DSM 19674]OVE95824.1 hypothetical protein LKACC16343_02576 [Companilactobacillus bobalius]GEO59322.1 hypothetical protein LBO01_24510 [Companilactobacillus paralimentarius]